MVSRAERNRRRNQRRGVRRFLEAAGFPREPADLVNEPAVIYVPMVPLVVEHFPSLDRRVVAERVSAFDRLGPRLPLPPPVPSLRELEPVVQLPPPVPSVPEPVPAPVVYNLDLPAPVPAVAPHQVEVEQKRDGYVMDEDEFVFHVNDDDLEGMEEPAASMKASTNEVPPKPAPGASTPGTNAGEDVALDGKRAELREKLHSKPMDWKVGGRPITKGAVARFLENGDDTAAWLCGQGLDAALEVVAKKARNQGKCVVAMRTDLVSSLMAGGMAHRTAERQRSLEEQFVHDHVSRKTTLVPVHTGNHWYLIVITREDNEGRVEKYSMSTYNSTARGDSERMMDNMEAVIKSHRQRNNRRCRVAVTKKVVEGPRQKNAVDCGVFAIEWAKRFALGEDMLFDQTHINRGRLEWAELLMNADPPKN